MASVRPLRALLTLLSFGMFFAAGAAIIVLGLPLVFLASALDRRRHRSWMTRGLSRLYPWFLTWMRLVGLIDYRRVTLPPDLPRDRPYLLVANHPTLIDVLFCLAWFPGITTMVKAAHYRSWWLFGLLLRSTTYVPGPGIPGDDDGAAAGTTPPPLARMVAQLDAGHPLVAFPEGTRAPPHRLLRFHRGPFEAALRARAPVVPLFIGVDHPALTKGAFWPRRRLRFTFDWLPVIDCAGPDAPGDSRTLRNEIYRRYRARQAAYLREIGV